VPVPPFVPPVSVPPPLPPPSLFGLAQPGARSRRLNAAQPPTAKNALFDVASGVMVLLKSVISAKEMYASGQRATVDEAEKRSRLEPRPVVVGDQVIDRVRRADNRSTSRY
jgi:hypothetical protein